MTGRKNFSTVSRRQSEKKRRNGRIFNATVAGILVALALAACFLGRTADAVCDSSAAGFVGWMLVSIGYAPLLIHASARALFGEAVAIPVHAWHLAAVDAVWIVFLWAAVRFAARRKGADFLRRAGHVALIVCVWCFFQLGCFAVAKISRRGGLDAAQTHFIPDETQVPEDAEAESEN